MLLSTAFTLTVVPVKIIGNKGMLKKRAKNEENESAKGTAGLPVVLARKLEAAIVPSVGTVQEGLAAAPPVTKA